MNGSHVQDRELCRRVLCSSSPFVFRGEARGWRAVRQWSLQWLASSFPSSPISTICRDGRRNYRLAELCALIAQGGNEYGVDWVFEEQHPELLDHLGTPGVAELDCFQMLPPLVRPRLLWAYIGGAGSKSAFHQDVLGTHAWLALLTGFKQWTFVSPTSDRRVLRLLQSPGDIVFIPSLWWHSVSNLTPTIAVTKNFCSYHIRDAVIAEAHRTGRANLVRALLAAFR